MERARNESGGCDDQAGADREGDGKLVVCARLQNCLHLELLTSVHTSGVSRSAAIKAGKSTSKKQKGKDNAAKNNNSTAATSKNTAKEIMYDNIFTSASPSSLSF
jgi:hypothetical protein